MDFIGENITRKAKKIHCCDLCGRSIQPGERYVSTFNVYDGYAFNFKRHELCNETMGAMYNQPDDGWTQEYFREELSSEIYDNLRDIARKYSLEDDGLDAFIDALTPSDIEESCRMLCAFNEFDRIKNEKI